MPLQLETFYHETIQKYLDFENKQIEKSIEVFLKKQEYPRNNPSKKLRITRHNRLKLPTTEEVNNAST